MAQLPQWHLLTALGQNHPTFSVLATDAIVLYKKIKQHFDTIFWTGVKNIMANVMQKVWNTYQRGARHPPPLSQPHTIKEYGIRLFHIFQIQARN